MNKYKKIQRKKEYQKYSYQNMSEKDKQKQRKYVKEHRRNKSRNVLKKIKENN